MGRGLAAHRYLIIFLGCYLALRQVKLSTAFAPWRDVCGGATRIIPRRNSCSCPLGG
jgi:hypothetical protein